MSKFVHTNGPCPHGPALPPHQYCVECQPGAVKVITTPAPVGEIPAAFRSMADAYDSPQPCASPHAAPVGFVDGVTPPGFARAQKQRRAKP